MDSLYSCSASSLSPQFLYIRACRKYWLIATSSLPRQRLRCSITVGSPFIFVISISHDRDRFAYLLCGRRLLEANRQAPSRPGKAGKRGLVLPAPSGIGRRKINTSGSGGVTGQGACLGGFVQALFHQATGITLTLTTAPTNTQTGMNFFKAGCPILQGLFDLAVGY